MDGPADLLNVNMDIIDIAMEIFESGTSSDLEVSLGLHGQFGITGIKLCMSPQVKFLIIFGVLLKNIFLSSKAPP